MKQPNVPAISFNEKDFDIDHYYKVMYEVEELKKHKQLKEGLRFFDNGSEPDPIE